MDNGDAISDFEEVTGFDVESLFVKKGCQLDAYKGIYYSFLSYFFTNAKLF